MNILGKKVILRSMELEDQEMLRAMVNDPEIERVIVGFSFPVSKYQQSLWYNSNQNDFNNIRLIIETEEDGPVGLANIVNIDWKNRSAFHGIKIGNTKFRTKGIGTDTVMAIMRYCFQELNLNRLDGAIINYNEASKKLYCDKCGWKIEGIRRKSIFKGNEYHDELIVGILKEEYLDLINSNHYWDE